MKKTIIFLSLTALFYSSVAWGQSTNLSFVNGSGYDFIDIDDELLTAGTDENNDGDVIQLGYIDIGNDGFQQSDFSSFTALTGLQLDGSFANGIDSTIGDFTGETGLTGYFDNSSNAYSLTQGQDTLPGETEGIYFAVRFFDSRDLVVGQTRYNTVTSIDELWSWSAPASPDPSQNFFNLGRGGPEAGEYLYEGAERDAQAGTITANLVYIPEPSTGALLAVGLMAAMAYRRRRA